ncbi:rod shape-determining protein [Clostridium polyendosporum]|uniref:Cell shape-determining protein MreB n=1 Tax=Clostridium polyendosporum TaxID=69208 RepID=A0A919VGY7_9CLOT|nr:rod shape-determining protein MreB [Clostridium polyendosporum]GIM29687.1 rod shape-determining protein [Clostridium polyendosporum]
MWFWGMGTDIGIDLGTATVLVYIKNKGVVLKEPSVVAVDENSNKILAVGEEARQMIGRTPGNIVAIRPLRDGVISNYDMTEKMLTYFIEKGCGKKRILAPKVMVCVPSQATPVEKRAVINAAKNSGAKSAYLIEEPLAAAVGAGLDISKPSGNMVVDIGGGTTDIAVISLGGIVVRSSIKVAGDKFNELILRYIRNKYKLMIGERTAEDLKINIRSVLKKGRKVTMPVRGRSLITGLPDEVNITTEEIRGALQESLEVITKTIHSVLKRTPPELSADIIDNGILMTGGGALLYGLDEYIESETGVIVRVAEESVSCVAKGAGLALQNFNNLKINSDMEVELV